MVHFSPLGGRPTVFFGPLRDRSPERAAEGFLEGLRGGKCQLIQNSTEHKVAFVNTDCAKESAVPLASWKLIDRSDSDEQVHLVYLWGNSAVPISHGDSMEVDAERQNGEWYVVTYDRVF
jgi:hypothetical protein